MNSSIDTHIDIQFSNQHDQFSDQKPNIATTLLLQPFNPRPKPLIVYDELRTFRITLKWFTLDHSSSLGKFISFSTFLFLSVIVPILSKISTRTTLNENVSVSFDVFVQFPESGLSAIAFFTLFRFFKKYTLRHLLFLDCLQNDISFVKRGYTRQLEKAFRYLACILLPSLFVELAHKIVFFSKSKISIPYVNPTFLLLNYVMFTLVLISWIYRTGLFLLVCILFRLTCELQILRFQGLFKMFEGFEFDAGLIYREHVRIKKQLSATSHRYRFFIISCAFLISVSQLGALLLVLSSRYKKNFLNSGDLVVCSAVELSGFFLCLLGAAKITHRAQGIASIASRWHMIVTYASAGAEQVKIQIAQDQINNNSGDLNRSNENSYDSDSDSSENVFIEASEQDCSLFQTRQALVSYLEHNSGGITLFGYKLDRGLLHTLFAFEFSLVLWILSKVVVLSSN